MKMCLYNTSSDNVAAWCTYHKCGITVKQMRCKECLKKQCYYLKKNEQHEYWKQRERLKQKKKDRKLRLATYNNKNTTLSS